MINLIGDIMIVTLTNLFVVFAIEHSNLLRVFPFDLNFESLDLEKIKTYDPIKVQYLSQGKYHLCVCDITVTENDVIILFYNDFELILNLPLLEYDTDDLKEFIDDKLSEDIFNVYNLRFKLSKTYIVNKLKELYLKGDR